MLSLINNLADRFEDRIRQTTAIDVRSLCFFRILFGVFTILFYWRSYAWIGAFPDSFFNPHILSLTSFLNGFPSLAFFKILDLGVIVFTVTVTIGLFTRVSTVSLLVLILVGHHFSNSFGKIDHDILFLTVPLVMIFQDWGRFLSLDSLRNPAPKPEEAQISNLALLGLLIAFGFFTAGYSKALNWIDFDLTTSGFVLWSYTNYFLLDRQELLAPYAVQLYSPWLWEIVDYSGVAFEWGFLPALLWRRSWFLWLTLACLFHLANCFLLNITFHYYSVVYLAFVPWRQFKPIRHLFSVKLSWVLTGLAVFCAISVVIKLRTGSSVFFSVFDIKTLWVAVVIWILMIPILALTVKYQWNQKYR